MKKIDRPEYAHIKKLLQSSNNEDAKIGAVLLKKEGFVTRDMLSCFPNISYRKNTHFLRNDVPKSYETFWCRYTKNYILGFHSCVFYFRDEEYPDFAKSKNFKEFKL